jgi:pimeloyl-ACP methyl ester carboxylesterase
MGIIFLQSANAQKKTDLPRLEPCPCAFKIDSTLKTTCAYLVVAENRTKPQGMTIKLPFIYVESPNPSKKKDPVLFTAGGPGLSTLHYAKTIQRRALLKNRDYIAFEQRGTDYAVPCLNCESISEQIKNGYRNNLSIDSIALEGHKRCRDKLLAQGIDLSAYNTDESAADIEDLRKALHIDSLNVMGISYSGGLLMAVLKKYPQHIRSLILDSPLPEFVNIDEEELANFDEALNEIFAANEADPVNSQKYPHIKQRFEAYFTEIGGRKFSIAYTEKGSNSSRNIQYGRNELLQILHGYVEDYDKIKEVPHFLDDLIKGNHAPYITDYLNGVFEGWGGASGMRFSVYCSDKMAYADKEIMRQQNEVFPFLSGFHVNDVYPGICDCWKVKPIDPETKKPFYSGVPILLGGGGLDDSCRPVYNDEIQHYMPNSQNILFRNRQHGPLLNSYEGDVFIAEFLDHPFGKLTSKNDDILVK